MQFEKIEIMSIQNFFKLVLIVLTCFITSKTFAVVELQESAKSESHFSEVRRSPQISETLSKLQNTFWQGQFHVKTRIAGLIVECRGPVTAEFFVNSGNRITYRNKADFSRAVGNPLLCHAASIVSPLKYSEDCAETFPVEFSARESLIVPVRTIIRGASPSGALLLSPKCDRQTGQVEHSSTLIESFQLSADQAELQIRIHREFLENFGEVDITYMLER